MNADGKLITMFAEEYPAEKQAEGIAISQTILAGECNCCMHFPICSTNETFIFPSGAACMQRKAKILKGWG